jgi:hypothetical protein
MPQHSGNPGETEREALAAPGIWERAAGSHGVRAPSPSSDRATRGILGLAAQITSVQIIGRDARAQCTIGLAGTRPVGFLPLSSNAALLLLAVT